MPKPLITLPQHSVLTAQKLVTDLCESLDEQEKIIGPEACDELMGNVIMLLVGAWISKALEESSPNIKTHKENVDFKYSNFKKTKALVETAVGMGVSSALSMFMGRDADFWCQIQPVPKPVNKTPC